MQITPAIFPLSFQEIEEKIEKIYTIAPRVQIDICDGIMGKIKTWMPEGGETLPHGASVEYEIDCMVSNWRDIFGKVCRFNPSRIIMHIDYFTEDDCKELAEKCKAIQIELGLCVSNDVAVTHFDELIRAVRGVYDRIFIQVMGIAEIGQQGAFFDDSCLLRILHSKKTFGDIEVQVDGGMRPETVPKVHAVGAVGAVVGSFIFGGENVSQSYSELAQIE